MSPLAYQYLGSLQFALGPPVSIRPLVDVPLHCGTADGRGPTCCTRFMVLMLVRAFLARMLCMRRTYMCLCTLSMRL
jgi:hypothetical protein